MKRGTQPQETPSAIRIATIAGIDAWIAVNQATENFRQRTRHVPRGTFSPAARMATSAISMRTS
jgi:hypothetical protein